MNQIVDNPHVALNNAREEARQLSETRNPVSTIASIPGAGIVPISDGRFGTRDIRLASALCCLGFALTIDKQPVSVTIDGNTEKQFVTFWHDDISQNESLNTGANKISARDIELWWTSPAGKFSIDGYDDALTAIRHVFTERDKLISASKSDGKGILLLGNVDSIATKSLHAASALSACGIPRLGYERRSRRWAFGKGAEVVMELIAKGGKQERPTTNDLCIDWMLEALRYRDWLAQLVKHPDNIPVIEMREGKKILQISAGMNERDRRKWISYL